MCVLWFDRIDDPAVSLNHVFGPVSVRLLFLLHLVFMGNLLVGCRVSANPESPLARDKQPNVLMVVVDDLNDWIGPLGHPTVKTPAFDRLAERAVNFEHAYSQAPLCNPSRVSFLTGVQPSVSGVYFNNQRHWRTDHWISDARPLPGSFLDQGYKVASYGKVFHVNTLGLDRGKKQIDAITGHFSPGQYVPHKLERGRLENALGHKKYSLRDEYTWVWGPLPDSWGRENPKKMQRDALNARRMADFLRKDHDKPFFAALGIYRPHLMYYAPNRFYRMYPLDEIEPPRGFKKGDLDDVAPVHDAMRRQGVHRELKKKDLWKQSIQGYLASISYADAQLGRVLKALRNSPHRNNTIVVVIGDHGYHNMEKKQWTKGVLWEQTLRTPMLIAVPWETEPGFRRATPVGLIDLYPTLVGLCGLEKPETHSLDGVDLTPVIRGKTTSRGRPVLSTYGRGNHSIRSRRYRYIRFRNGQEELYDHQHDPHEWNNRVADPDLAGVRERLKRQLPDENTHCPVFSVRGTRTDRAVCGQTGYRNAWSSRE